MDLTYDKKKWIGIVLLLVFAILSFSAGAKYASARRRTYGNSDRKLKHGGNSYHLYINDNYSEPHS